jgi:hypothetical protein
MVAEISKLVTEYEIRVRGMQKVPRLSYGRLMLWPDGAPNRLFFCSLFNDVMTIAVLIARSTVITFMLEF